jgi:hypothetical protein
MLNAATGVSMIFGAFAQKFVEDLKIQKKKEDNHEITRINTNKDTKMEFCAKPDFGKPVTGAPSS